MKRNLRLLLSVVLVGCAPAALPNTVTEISNDEQTRLCALNPRVGERGRLDYGQDSTQGSVSPDYRLDCPDLSVRVEGQALLVAAPTLDAALAVFGDSAFFPAYFADLRVRLADGRVDADPSAAVPDTLREQVNAVTVTVTPLGGTPRTLVVAGQVTPVTLEPGTTYRVTIRTRGTPNPWPSVTVDPQGGTIEATIGR